MGKFQTWIRRLDLVNLVGWGLIKLFRGQIRLFKLLWLRRLDLVPLPDAVDFLLLLANLGVD